MKLLYNSIFLEHDTGMHPENPKRLEVFEELPDSPLVDGAPHLMLVHSPSYIDKVEEASHLGARLDQDTITSKGTYDAARYAVGMTIAASESNDFALVRPPGHHAYPKQASGFCLFNNVAIAAQKLVKAGKRVAIFDFDGHMGDGTCDIFYNTDKVLYWSIHQYPAFPGHGFIEEVGEANGKGYTINLPIPPGSGDDIFINAIKNLMPVMEQFEPDVVAVSAGFDAHKYDLLLQLNASANSFYTIGEMLRERFPRIFAVLEGGYNVEHSKGVFTIS